MNIKAFFEFPGILILIGIVLLILAILVGVFAYHDPYQEEHEHQSYEKKRKKTKKHKKSKYDIDVENTYTKEAFDNNKVNRFMTNEDSKKENTEYIADDMIAVNETNNENIDNNDDIELL